MPFEGYGKGHQKSRAFWNPYSGGAGAHFVENTAESQNAEMASRGISGLADAAAEGIKMARDEKQREFDRKMKSAEESRLAELHPLAVERAGLENERLEQDMTLAENKDVREGEDHESKMRDSQIKKFYDIANALKPAFQAAWARRYSGNSTDADLAEFENLKELLHKAGVEYNIPAEFVEAVAAGLSSEGKLVTFEHFGKALTDNRIDPKTLPDNQKVLAKDSLAPVGDQYVSRSYNYSDGPKEKTPKTPYEEGQAAGDAVWKAWNEEYAKADSLAARSESDAAKSKDLMTGKTPSPMRGRPTRRDKNAAMQAAYNAATVKYGNLSSRDAQEFAKGFLANHATAIAETISAREWGSFVNSMNQAASSGDSGDAADFYSE